MWPLFKKELREHTRFLVAAFVILPLVLDHFAWKRGWALLPLASAREMLPFTSARLDADRLTDPLPIGAWGFACALVAGSLAVRQVLMEKRGKTWPLLVHLPVGRTRIVLGKLLAGLCLYTIVAAPLGLLILVRLSIPGVWPGPFYARVILPLVWSFLAMAAVYLAVFAAALRPARWYATKWLIALAGAPAVLLAVVSREFGIGTTYGRLNFFHSQASVFLRILVPATLTAAALCVWAILQQARTREY